MSFKVLFNCKIKYLPSRKGERYASALAYLSLSNKISRYFGKIDLKDLSKLCNNYPENKFLVTCLSLNDQHELTVLGRKHQNLKIFGLGNV